MSDRDGIFTGALAGNALGQARFDMAQQQLKQAKTLAKTDGRELDAKGHATKEEKTLKAATDFEALLLNQMMQSMWKTVPKGTLLSGSREEGIYRDMLNQAVAEHVAENSSIGIKDVIMKEFEKSGK